MPKRKIEADYDEKSRADAHRMIDTIFDMRLACIIAGKQTHGGYMWRAFGDRRSLVSLARKLLDLQNNCSL